MGIKTDKELIDFRARYKEASIHMIIHIVIWAIVIYAVLTFLNKDIVYIVLGLLSIIAFIFMITREVASQHMIVYSWICLVCVMASGVAVGRFNYIKIILPMIVYVCIIDVLSFTRFGKKTANAKLMNNNKWLPRLIVYGRSFKTGKPVATKGFGDYLWYSIAFTTIYTTYGKTVGLCATIGPLGLCVILVVIISI